MLSRPSALPVSPSPPLPPLPRVSTTAGGADWDVFCRIIDNFGDIGVCWRLARQLASEHHLRVRLWVDELATFRLLCPQVDPTRAVQELQGIEVRLWEKRLPAVTPAAVVVETFACRIPEPFVERMAKRSPRPVWINLDYLSAEAWVPTCHTLPSPQPQLPLEKFFFFPGFTADTGGLLRERDLLERRRQFVDNAGMHDAFWRRTGFTRPPVGHLLVSLFAYDNAVIGDLLAIWADAGVPLCCLAPLSQTLPAIRRFAGRALEAGDTFRRGTLEVRVLPFLRQEHYDQLLWLCDVNFIRGEDSFVRAQWAARPLVWHIYPQQEGVHIGKLDAFLAIYCADLPAASALALRQFWHAWNVGRIETSVWQALAANLPTLREHAIRWQDGLAQQDDLSRRLVNFAGSKL
ncbi:elongation factor P maturation arginine rhamnosyltransferase EarP [Accumulibacter sp.]|uniref:elongation factor P maturation arginine rhamnosyltransferase EarP n=1 Tax=Accumulibacter sp. TaxID=2053492 RepID=UPI00262840B3|nr:elongation factor P maturation arginine rhamnosyltransferase EarP [Accumulibacter sp.]